MYPTVTTANASAIASGHYLGDTGDYGNTLFVDFPVPCRLGAVVTFLEDDCVLKDMKDHFHDKLYGPDHADRRGARRRLQHRHPRQEGPGGDPEHRFARCQGCAGRRSARRLHRRRDQPPDQCRRHARPRARRCMASSAPRPSPPPATTAPAFTSSPNLTQQSWLVSIAAQALVPDLKDNGKPFVLLYWSRDPDATQHSAIDSEGRLVPGINNPSSRVAIGSADFQLRVLLEALKLAGQDGNTDVFVTADHGFSTIAKGTPPADGATPVSSLPQGFLALDVGAVAGRPEAVRPRPLQCGGPARTTGDPPEPGQRPDRPQRRRAARHRRLEWRLGLHLRAGHRRRGDRQDDLRQADRRALCRRPVRERRPARRRPGRLRRRAADEQDQPDRVLRRAAALHRGRVPLLPR